MKTRRNKALANKPAATRVQSKFMEGFALHQAGYLAQARDIYQVVLKLQPQHFDALHCLGCIAYQSKNPALAVELIGKAIQLKTDRADVYINLGVALSDMKQHQAAVDRYDQAIQLSADSAAAYYNRGNALNHLQQHQAAIDSYDKAIQLEPEDAQTYYNRGVALNAVKQHQAAIDSYDKAIQLQAEDAQAYNNRGVALNNMKQHQAAVDSYEKAIQLQPDYARAYNNRGVALNDLRQHQAAIDSYDKAIQLEPGYAQAYSNRGVTLSNLKQYQAAIDSFDRALAINPDYEFLLGLRVQTKMLVCDWSDFDNQIAQLTEKIERNEEASPPFSVLFFSGAPALQRKAAAIWVADKHPVSFEPGNMAKRARREKIRIGYYSADYGEHAAGYMTATLFEQHDRSRFELVAFSFGSDRESGMRKRIAAAFEAFIDVTTQSDNEIALLSRNLEVDIAVDLMGFTRDSRFGIFGHRAAPIQVGYMGYPGTTGSDCIDYFVADRIVIPQACQRHYSEKIACLPHSYLISDANRQMTTKVFAREELGLPERGFVFCCFNGSQKITPVIFDGWMRILQQVDGSVLWLLEDNPTAAENLRREAAQRGVTAQRLVFAERRPISEHLARHRAADLFLDTLPCNAHTTASDALWVGLPVLTCMGEAFASRVAASQLNAIDLPELITTTQEQYEALAVELATHPTRLRGIKNKLARNRLTTPLFDTPLITKHIEDAYTQMYERNLAGLPPQHIYVAAPAFLADHARPR